MSIIREMEPKRINTSGPDTPPTLRFARRETVLRAAFGKLPKQMRFDRKGTAVYVLVDPRDDTVRYLGVTNDVPKRYESHASGRTQNRRLKSWSEELRETRNTMKIFVLGFAIGRRWAGLEKCWIAWFRGQQFDLLNRHEGGRYNPLRPGGSRHDKIKRRNRALALTGSRKKLKLRNRWKQISNAEIESKQKDRELFAILSAKKPRFE